MMATEEAPKKSDKAHSLLVNIKNLNQIIVGGMNNDNGPSRLEQDPDGLAADILEYSDFMWKDIKSGDKKKLPKTLDEWREFAATLPRVDPTPCSVDEFTKFLSGGFRPGWIIIVGAFTGGGKTTWCAREAVHKAYLGNPVLYISCELAGVEVQSKIDLAASEDGFGIPPLPIRIEDSISSLGDILNLITDWKTSLPVDGKTPVVILDYLQRVRSGAQSNREREVAVVAEELQQLTKKLGIILMAAAQLNRSSQFDETGGPKLHHLRESGLIEQIADVAFLLHKTGEDRMNIDMAKNRWGPGDKQVEYVVDFARCRITPISQNDRLSEFAEKVVEHLQGCKDSKAKQRDVCRAIRIGNRRPSNKDISEAGRISRKFAVLNGSVELISDKIV